MNLFFCFLFFWSSPATDKNVIICICSFSNPTKFVIILYLNKELSFLVPAGIHFSRNVFRDSLTGCWSMPLTSGGVEKDIIIMIALW